MVARNIFIFLFVIIVVGLLFSCNQKPTETTPVVTAIAGTVTDKDNNNVISGAQVTTSPTTSSVMTDASGNYTISNLSTGQYVVTASKEGYNQSSISVTVTEGKTTPGDIRLEAVKPQLVASVSTIDFGTSQTNASFTTSNASGVGTITWTAASSVNWLSISSTSGTLSTSASTITVIANRSGLTFGNYTAAINLTSNAGNIVIPVTLSVINPNAPQLTVSPSLLQFGDATTTMIVNVQNTGTGTLTWSATPSQSWISLSKTSDSVTTGLASINVTVARSSLSSGSYSGLITFSSNGGSQTVNVMMNVPSVPVLSVSPSSLDFDSTKTQQSISINNTGSGSLAWSVSSNQNWMTINPASGTNTGTVNVVLNRSGLSPGDYSGIVTLTSNGGNTNINVTMHVASPVLSVSTSSLNFDSTKTQQSFSVSNTGSGSLTWSASSNQSWMTINPTSGTNTGTVNVTVSRSGFSSGNYSGIVALTSNGGNANVGTTMRVAPTYPPTPVTLQTGTKTINSVVVSWTAYGGSDFAAYKLYYSTSPAVNESSILSATIIQQNTNTNTISGLNSNTTYYFRIYVMNQSQLTSGSNIVTAQTGVTLPSWQQVALPVNFQVQSIHYISESNIWVAGYTTIGNYNFRRIYQFNGSVWIQSNVQAQDSTGTLTAIAFRNNSEGWATSASRLYKFDGTTWNVYNYKLNTETTPYGISEAIGTSSDVWSYGRENYQPVIYQWNGSSLTRLVPTTSSSQIIDMHFYNSTTGFAIDNYCYAYMYNGVGWLNLGDFSSSTGYSISGTSKNDVWASDGNYLYHYDGTKWNRINDIGGNAISYNIGQLRMISPTEGWATQRYSPYNVYYYNGASWNQQAQSLSGQLQEMKDFGSGNLWGIIYSNNSNPNKLMRLQ
jgi:hypothetical protein